MKKGFTLSESLTVIFILGIIAVVTMPNLINKRERSNNRITLMKAVNTYKAIITDEYYKATGVTTINDFNDYLKKNDYSKITSKLNAQNTSCNSTSCTFSTADKVNWNVSTPNKVIVGLKGTAINKNPDNLAKNTANEKVFYITFNTTNGHIQFLSSINNCTAKNKNNQDITGINCIQKTRNFILGE